MSRSDNNSLPESMKLSATSALSCGRTENNILLFFYVDLLFLQKIWPQMALKSYGLITRRGSHGRVQRYLRKFPRRALRYLQLGLAVQDPALRYERRHIRPQVLLIKSRLVESLPQQIVEAIRDQSVSPL